MTRQLCLLMLLLTFAAGISSAQDSSLLVGKPYENSHFAVIDSVLIHYRAWNEDKPSPRGSVLLIHGFTGSTWCYRKNIDTLVRVGYRVVAVDLPGFGYSGRNPAVNQSQSNRARLLWELLATVDGSDTVRWNIVGHSMGGGTAEAMAIMKPARTKSLLIVDGMVFNKNSNMMVDLNSMVRVKPVRKVQLSYVRHNMLTYRFFEKQLKKAYRRPPDTSEVMGYLTPMEIPGSDKCVLSVFTNAKEIMKLHSDTLSRLPVNMIWGSKDSKISPAIAKQFRRSNPTVGLEYIKGSGHIPMETHPEEFDALLMKWLNSVN